MDKQAKIELAEKYRDREAINHHKENALMLAENFGTRVQAQSMKEIIRKTRTRSMTDMEYHFVNYVIHPLFDNIRQEYLELREN
mgnify:FL=1